MRASKWLQRCVACRATRVALAAPQVIRVLGERAA